MNAAAPPKEKEKSDDNYSDDCGMSDNDMFDKEEVKPVKQAAAEPVTTMVKPKEEP